MKKQITEFFRDKKVLVTGGAGFVGSNIAHKLVHSGAKVTVFDNFHKDYGANMHNFKGIEGSVNIVRGDITDLVATEKVCANQDVIFHCAAQCSHVDSMTDPWTDLDFNCKGTLSVLEGARKTEKKPAVIYAGTRAIVGIPNKIPADEQVLPNPVDVYGVNKHAAEMYGAVYARFHKVPFVSIRLTNCYGPLHQMKNGKYGILNWFLSLALQKKPIKIFGTGEQLRDYLYIEDAAEAFLSAAVFAESMRTGKSEHPEVQLSGNGVAYAVFNIGTGKGKKFADCAKLVASSADGTIEFVPWPEDRKAIETGDYVSDGSAATKLLDWSPSTSFEDGMTKTVEYYKNNLKHYL